MKDGVYIIEIADESFGNYYVPSDILYKKQSEFQEIMIFDTKLHGKILMLNDALMFNENTEFYYHEAVVHPAMLLHSNPENVLIIGGGDGGTLREVLKHNSVKNIVLVEIDEEVINASRKFFPEMTSGFDDSRVTVQIQNGVNFVKETKDKFDVVIIDSNDVMMGKSNISNPLITDEFYFDLKSRMNKGFIGVQLTSHPYFFKDSFIQINSALSRNFTSVYSVLAPVPFFISSLWGIGLFSMNKLDIYNPRTNEIASLKYYNESVHKSLFAIPNHLIEPLRNAGVRV
ncbi:MAG: polyamine aminopropyltransferase [Planctomycetes bacterium]|nr:polyamine aminopropyltransferase [Planctomycetota bacterium]